MVAEPAACSHADSGRGRRGDPARDAGTVPHPASRGLLALGIDGVVEQFCTGLMLADRSAAEIQAIGASTAYFRFAIVYEPVARTGRYLSAALCRAACEMLPGGPGLPTGAGSPALRRARRRFRPGVRHRQ